jgi:hypothetical protein
MFIYTVTFDNVKDCILFVLQNDNSQIFYDPFKGRIWFI